MTRGLRLALSHFVGWAADRRIPAPLRSWVYRGFARYAGADLAEVRLGLEHFPSLGAFFVRELRPGARPVCAEPDAIVSPVDGTVQSLGRVERGTVLQAKGRAYALADLLGAAGRGVELEGGSAWTVYLSPRDYHRIHAPEACRLDWVEWIAGNRFSVAPAVLARRRVLDVNERCVLRLHTPRGPLLLVLVGALNVGRIRVVGVEPGASGPRTAARSFERGEELARFEMGSTIVLVAPAGVAEIEPRLRERSSVRLGAPIGRWIPR